jgi:hypothetical protein
MVSLYNNKLNGILADEMGLGKTVQVGWAGALGCGVVGAMQACKNSSVGRALQPKFIMATFTLLPSSLNVLSYAAAVSGVCR